MAPPRPPRLALLWVIHRIHRADAEVHVSTAVRHLPLEPLLRALLQHALLLLMSAPTEAAIAYTLLATGQTIFAHGNVRL